MIKMKSILSEAYAWEREAGKALPTMKSVQEKYEKNLKEQGDESFEADLDAMLRDQGVDPDDDHSAYFKRLAKKKRMKDDDKHSSDDIKGAFDFFDNDDDYDNDYSDPLIDEAYDSHNMSALIELYHQYKDGGMSKEIFYQLLKILNPDEREELMGYIKTRRDDEKYNLPDDSPMDYSEDFMEEAYDAKGVEEAEDKKPAKKSDKKSKPKRWQDDDGDGNWYEKGDDVSEGDESALNMGSLEESKFWGRVKGNFKGHEYILREAFRK